MLPEIKSSDEARQQIERFFPRTSRSSMDHIVNSLYPGAMGDKSGHPRLLTERVQRVLHEGLVACNSYALSTRFPTYKYVTRSAWNTVTYKIWDNQTRQDNSSQDGTNTNTPKPFMLNFVLHGDPNDVNQGLPSWPQVGAPPQQLVFAAEKTPELEWVDDQHKSRCEWWMELHTRPDEERNAHDVFWYPGRGDPDLKTASSAFPKAVVSVVGVAVALVAAALTI